MLRLESEDLWVDMSGLDPMDAMSNVLDVQTLVRCDDGAYKCLDGVLKLTLMNALGQA